MNRRHFIKFAGIAAGVTASLPLHAYADFLFDGRPPLKVGILLPHSTMYSAIGQNLIAGITLQFREAGWNDTKVLVRWASQGSEITEAVTLLNKDGVELLTGMFNPLAIHRLQEHLKQSGAHLINMEGGANVFHPREEAPFICHNSLGYWQSNWAMGQWAAAHMGKRAAFISSFYETGYDSHYAFPQGFHLAGGQIIHRDITLAPMGHRDLGKTMNAIIKAQPDFVFISSSGQEAVEFISAYHAAGLATSIPLAASSLFLHNRPLNTMDGTDCDITTCVSWASVLDSPANKKFCADFSRATGGQPDAFAVLGYDTGTLIVRAVQAAADRGQQTRTLQAALDDLTITSPRGTLTVSATGGSAAVPLYICQTSRRGSRVSDTILLQLPNSNAIERQAHPAALIAQSGWTDSYLCV